MNLQELKTLPLSGAGLALATRDAELRPEMSDVYGCILSEDVKKMQLFVSSSETSGFLANIENNQWVALSLARPTDDASAQVKGRVTQIRSITPEELKASILWATKYREQIMLIGFSPVAANALKLTPDTTLEVEVTELYIQTPGSAAGHPLEAQ